MADNPERWWHTLLTFVPRETYLKATRALSDARGAYYDERAKADHAERIMREQRAFIAALDSTLADQRAQMVLVRVALSRVAEYSDGIAQSQPVPLLVDGVVRDHEELEARIEAVLDLILTRRDVDGLDIAGSEYATLNKIAGLLQGQVPRVPDTLEGWND